MKKDLSARILVITINGAVTEEGDFLFAEPVEAPVLFALAICQFHNFHQMAIAIRNKILKENPIVLNTMNISLLKQGKENTLNNTLKKPTEVWINHKITLIL